MGWFKKVFRKSKGKRSSYQSTENQGKNDASDHGNEPEPEGDHPQPEAPEENKDDPEENKDEENTNGVAPTSPDHEPPQPDYQPWRPAGYHQQEGYHRGGFSVSIHVGTGSGQQNLGSFSHPPQYIGHGVRSTGRYTGNDHFAGSSGQVNNYWSPPRMLDYDRWNRGQSVNSVHDVWTTEYWQGLLQPPHGGWP